MNRASSKKDKKAQTLKAVKQPHTANPKPTSSDVQKTTQPIQPISKSTEKSIPIHSRPNRQTQPQKRTLKISGYGVRTQSTSSDRALFEVKLKSGKVIGRIQRRRDQLYLSLRATWPTTAQLNQNTPQELPTRNLRLTQGTNTITLIGQNEKKKSFKVEVP